MSDEKYSITIYSDNAYMIEQIVNLAEIEISEGRNVTDARYIWRFLDTISSGLRPDWEGFVPIVGTRLADVLAEWETVSDYCKRISDRIDKIIEEYRTPTEPQKKRDNDPLRTRPI